MDDDRAILEITKLNLEANDYRIVTASDGVEAFALYEQRQQEIKLVVTDLLMPLMNGLELARRLRNINPAVKVIGISGQGPSDNAARPVEPPLPAFSIKPFTTETLLVQLHQALAN